MKKWLQIALEVLQDIGQARARSRMNGSGWYY